MKMIVHSRLNKERRKKEERERERTGGGRSRRSPVAAHAKINRQSDSRRWPRTFLGVERDQ